MPTVADTITFALRLARVTASGESPTAEEANDGLFAVQGMFDQWVSSGVFGLMTDNYQTQAYSAKEQEIVITDGSPAITIPTLYDADGNVPPNPTGQRAPLDIACIQVQDRTAGTTTSYIYDRGWTEVQALVLTDPMPLASRGQDGLAACVGIRYVETFGVGKVTPMMINLAGKFMGAMQNRRIAARAPETAYY